MREDFSLRGRTFPLRLRKSQGLITTFLSIRPIESVFSFETVHINTVLLQSSELHCQIANLLNQLETGEAERQQLESNLHHSQQESFRTLQEKEKEWREQKESLQSKGIHDVGV